MKQIAGKTGTALLMIWIIGMIVILLIGLGSDGPIDGPAFINVWTFYGFVLGTPAVAAAMMGWANRV